MKIKAVDIFEHIGNVVKISDNNQVKRGDYVIVETLNEEINDVVEEVVVLYNVREQLVTSAVFEPEFEMTIIYTPMDERIELLLDANMSIAMTLMHQANVGDNYGPSEEQQSMIQEMQPVLEKIKVLREIKGDNVN